MPGGKGVRTVGGVIEELSERRLERLRIEMMDENVPVPLDGDVGQALLEEIAYARHPPIHEGRAPRFGAIVASGDSIAHRDLGIPALVESADDAELAVVRRLADGRTSFVGRLPSAIELVCFDRTIEHEANAVDVACDAGVAIVQARPGGGVRVFTPDGVVSWDGYHWSAKPLAAHLTAALLAVEPGLDNEVLHGLCSLAVHWLSAGRVGGLLVWQIDRKRAMPGHVGLGASRPVPALSLTQRHHFAAILNVLAQTDRAAVVTADGRLERIGVALRPSDEAVAAVAAHRGTRHTSARRFSYDEPSTIVLAVSSAGPVTVFRGGDIISVATSTAAG